MNQQQLDLPALTGSQARVLEVLREYPWGACRRIFAEHDIYEVSARVGELQALGYRINTKEKCWRHSHRKGTRFSLYRLET